LKPAGGGWEIEIDNLIACVLVMAVFYWKLLDLSPLLLPKVIVPYSISMSLKAI
jgi:hypothetical protein